METTGWIGDHQAISAAVAALSLFLLYKMLTRRQSRLPPGPKGWPIIGNMYEIFSHARPLDLFAEYKRKYGDLFTFYLGSYPVVVINSLEKYTETIVNEQNKYAGRPLTNSLSILSEGGKSIVFGDFSETWKVQRKIAHSAIRKYASGQQLENLVHNSFDQFAALLEKEKEPFNPSFLLSLLVYNIIFNMTCGKNWRVDDPKLKELIDLADEINLLLGKGIVADIFPVFQYLPSSTSRKFKEAADLVNKLFAQIMEEHRQNFDPENQKDLTDALIASEQEERKAGGNAALSRLERAHYTQILSDVVFAGTDTTRYTLMWVVIYMARNPGCQKKMQAEIEDLLGNQPVTVADRQNLHYTTAVLHETLRMRAIAPLAVPHTTLCDCVVGGYHLPKGTEVWPNLDALHKDERHWKNPHTFDVNHFLDSEGKFAGVPPAFKPFSGGRRVCVGEALAKSELLMLIAMFFQKFSVSAPEGKEVKDEIAPNSVLGIPNAFEVVVTSRK